MEQERYLELLESENKALRENIALRRQIDNLKQANEQIVDERDDLENQLTMCETLIWKLGLEALNEKKDIISVLANAVKKMQEESPTSDVDSIVEEVYNRFKTPQQAVGE